MHVEFYLGTAVLRPSKVLGFTHSPQIKRVHYVEAVPVRLSVTPYQPLTRWSDSYKILYRKSCRAVLVRLKVEQQRTLEDLRTYQATTRAYN